MDEEERQGVYEPGSPFFQNLNGYMDWQPFTEDHTGLPRPF